MRTTSWWIVGSLLVCATACGGTGEALGPGADERAAEAGEQPEAAPEERERALVLMRDPEATPPEPEGEEPEEDDAGPAADAFAEAERLYAAIDAIDPPTPADVSAWVAARTNAVATSVAAYARVIGAGEPEWSVAAYVRMGECYRDLGEALATMPAPEGVPEEHLGAYREQLEGYRGPMMETARSMWLNAREVANREGLETRWTERAEALLAGAE